METVVSLYKNLIFAASRRHVFEKSMLDASADCIKLIALDGTLTTMNQAGCIALGVPEDSGFGMPWLSLLPETARGPGGEALDAARQGRNVRFPSQSTSPDGTRYWDNLLTPVTDAEGRVDSILCVARDVTEKAQLERELADAVLREKLLSQEMRHRIKNMFAVVSGLITLAEKEAMEDGCSQSATTILRRKVNALGRASDVFFATSPLDGKPSNMVDVEGLVRSVLEPYGEQFEASGSAVQISRSKMTTMVLFLHELATNSIKYGAFSMNSGKVEVRWQAEDEEFRLTWTERGGPPISQPPETTGFGSEMIERMMRSIGGTVEKAWDRDGLVATLRMLPRE